MFGRKFGGDVRGQLDAIGRSQAVIEFDPDGTIITANKNFLDVLGYRLEEVQGRHHSMFVAAEQRDSSEYRVFWAALNRGAFQASEFQRLTKNGREIWIEASYNPVFDREGKTVKVVKYATNVTQQVAPSGIFTSPFWTPLANPFISAQQRGAIITAAEAGRTAADPLLLADVAPLGPRNQYHVDGRLCR